MSAYQHSDYRLVLCALAYFKMNNLEWFVHFNLPRNFQCLEFAKNSDTFLFFKRETLEGNFGYQSDVLVGRIIYEDKSEKDDENGCVMLENLQAMDYHSPESKVFLDIQHLRLMMKKLGEFHAYSYLAKETHPEEFFPKMDYLVETNFAAVKMLPDFLQRLLEFYLDLLSQDERYKGNADDVRRIITNADDFVADVFSTRNEPTAVLCHGDFLRNNVLFKYDSNRNPIDMKFIDVANMKYCTPVVDLALVLYMNTDQLIRDEYWDELLDVYYESLKNTFPNCKVVPLKNQIVSEFKRNALQVYLSVMYFIPFMLEKERSGDEDWLNSLYSPEYEEYKNKPMVSVPVDILIFVIKKFHVGRSRELVLDVLKDMINKGFV